MAGQRNRIRRQRAKARSMSEAEAGAARVPEVEVDGEVVTAGERNCVVQRKIPLSPKEELRRSLISQIRGYYLDAISRLPTTELATTLARGLLVAGHCYGPLHPVHNIIVNSVWHSAAFPMRPGDRIDAAVVSSDTLSRLVQRSLDGLVASLRHLCPGLSDDDDALWHLSLSRADLRAAVASARGAAPSSFRPTASELEAAFEAAAKAARHPKHRGTCALRLVRCTFCGT
uniref:PIR2-like helical domain-containing protein n=1 Tax=Aegilops tauschii subsp. strangulata TaxID=200361 RepID=A0A453G1C3_AEGTS